MHKTKLQKHSRAVQAVDLLYPEQLNEAANSLTIESFSSFFSKVTSRVSKKLGQPGIIPPLQAYDNIKLGILKEALAKVSFTDIVRVEMYVREDFQGQLLEYTRALVTAFKQHDEVILDKLDKMKGNLEKILTNKTTVDYEVVQDGAVDDTIGDQWTKGHGEVALIGHCFGNLKEIHQYAVASRLKINKQRLVEVNSAVKRVHELMNAVAHENDLVTSKQEVKKITQDMLNLAILTTEYGKAVALLTANYGVANNLVDTILETANTLTKK